MHEETRGEILEAPSNIIHATSSLCKSLQCRNLNYHCNQEHSRRIDHLEVLARVDAVIVASTTDTHYGVIKAGLLAGKSVFTEKPISHNPVEVHLFF